MFLFTSLKSLGRSTGVDILDLPLMTRVGLYAAFCPDVLKGECLDFAMCRCVDDWLAVCDCSVFLCLAAWFGLSG